jgi:hypothetical protein
MTHAASAQASPDGERRPGVRPRVRILDARTRGLDEDGLRSWARMEGAGAAHTTRSYCYPYAVVAVHARPVGVDIERREPHDATFVSSISTPSELGRDLDPASLWCSKEALAKALGDALRYDPRRLESPMLWPDGRSGPWAAEELTAPPDHVAWLCWRH